MKIFSFLFVLGLMALSINSFSQIKVNSTGKVGINNTSPSYQLDVEGDFRVSDGYDEIIYEYGQLYPSASWSSLGTDYNMWDELYAYDAYFYYYTTYYSDERSKTDIKDLTPSKDKIKLLRPVKYKMKPKEKEKDDGQTETKQKPETEQIGFIAQEMQEIFPEIVSENKNGHLGIRYTALIPILVKAIQEQQTEIDELLKRIEKLENAKK